MGLQLRMADYLYNGQRPTLRDRIGAFLARKEAAPVAFFAGMTEATWMTPNARNYMEQGYRINSAIFTVTKALANGFAEAPLKCYTDETKKKDLPKHPVKLLFREPNPYMGEDEFWKHVITYASTTGNGYGKITPSKLGTASREIYPYSDVVMWAIPGEQEWVVKFVYSRDDGAHTEDVDPKLVAHWKWAVDPIKPWQGMGALAPVAREVDTDNELTRFLKAFLQNDAVMSGILYTPEGVMLTPSEMQKVKQDFERNQTGNNAGRVTVMPRGMRYERAALNMQELALDALRGVPEARIAAAYGVPAIVAGLNIGLARSTYSNFEEARKAFTEQTLVPLWKAMAAEVQSSIVPLFGNDVYVDFDTSQVRALQEGNDKKAVWVTLAYEKGVLERDEARAELGLQTKPTKTEKVEIDKMQVRLAAQAGIYTVNEARAEFGLGPIEGGDVPLPVMLQQGAPAPDPLGSDAPPADNGNGSGDGNADNGKQPPSDKPQGAQDGGKALDTAAELKAFTEAQEAAVRRIQATMSKAIGDGYDSIAAHVEK
jgi:HK97 family phage portal protein